MQQIDVERTNLPIIHSNKFTGSIYSICFDDTKQLDRLIGILQDAKTKYIREKQKEFDNRHQLSLNFSE